MIFVRLWTNCFYRSSVCLIRFTSCIVYTASSDGKTKNGGALMRERNRSWLTLRYEFSDFHNGDVPSRGLLSCDTCSVVVGYHRFRGSYCLHLQEPLKRCYPTTTLHGVTTQKTTSNITALTASNLASDWMGDRPIARPLPIQESTTH
jgi:hypothetical protein